MALVIDQGHRIFGGDFGRHAKPQQSVDRVVAHHHTCEFALVIDRHQDLQGGGSVVVLSPLQGARINRLTQVSGQSISAVGFSVFKRFAYSTNLRRLCAWRKISRLETASGIHPCHRQQLWVLIDQSLGLCRELCWVNFLVRNVARHAHQLLLPLQQPKSQTLLSVFNVPFESLLLAIGLLQPQVAKSGDNGRQKQYNGQQGAEHEETVLP